MSVDHYENFPVASILLPGPLRRPVSVIYRFARGADDIADEGTLSDAQRLHGLDRYRRAIDRIAAGEQPEPEFVALGEVMRAHTLPPQLFLDLLDAFAQDVTTRRYADFVTLLDYCRRSANPVGRLLLHLAGCTDQRHLQWSDAICTALQLANFWQDIAVDWTKGRIYLPAEDLARFGLDESAIAHGRLTDAWRALIAFEVERTRRMMRSGAPLIRELPGRISWEIRFTVLGGLRILDRIDACGGDVFRQRPVLGGTDWVLLFLRALSGQPRLLPADPA